MGLGRDVALDVGTVTTRIYVPRQGMVLQEPSAVAVEALSGRVLAFGREAYRALHRMPGAVTVRRPLRGGTLADFRLAQLMLRHFLQQVLGYRSWIGRPRVAVCLPAGFTPVERRAILEALLEAGVRSAVPVEAPLAAALGANLDVRGPEAAMVVDVGGGTVDAAVLALGGVVVSRSVPAGGVSMDEALVRYVRQRFGLLLGERAAEEAKIRLGSALPGGSETLEVRGRDLYTGLPRSVELTAHHVWEALREVLDQVVAAVREVLASTPPELASDLIDRGMVLVGGGSRLRGLDALLARETGLPARVAAEPETCVVLGAGRLLG